MTTTSNSDRKSTVAAVVLLDAEAAEIARGPARMAGDRVLVEVDLDALARAHYLHAVDVDGCTLSTIPLTADAAVRQFADKLIAGLSTLEVLPAPRQPSA